MINAVDSGDRNMESTQQSSPFQSDFISFFKFSFMFLTMLHSLHLLYDIEPFRFCI